MEVHDHLWKLTTVVKMQNKKGSKMEALKA